MHTATIAVYPTAKGLSSFRVRRERITSSTAPSEDGAERPGHPAWLKTG